MIQVVTGFKSGPHDRGTEPIPAPPSNGAHKADGEAGESEPGDARVTVEL